MITAIVANLSSKRLTNHFSDCRVISLAKLKMASEINPRDPRGPYLVVQEGYDPADLTMRPHEFLLGRSGGWLASHWFLLLPVAERRAEFIFGTLAELTEVIDNLSGPVQVIRAKPERKSEDESEEEDWDNILTTQTD